MLENFWAETPEEREHSEVPVGLGKGDSGGRERQGEQQDFVTLVLPN